ncbi:MAG: hypothetical protein ACOCYW_07700 [Roseicyclus sp.]
MRKPQVSGRRPADSIVLRTARTTSARTTSMPARRPGPEAEAEARKLATARRGGATMDYQMGFTSDPAH